MRRGAVGLVCCGLIALAGCGGGAADSAPDATSASPTAPSTTTTTPAPTTASPTGTPAPEALSRFRCQQVSTGWAAAGYLSNTGKQKATFQVTVYLGPADGSVQDAVTQRVADVAAGDSVRFRIADVPVAGEGPCHVQVLRSSR